MSQADHIAEWTRLAKSAAAEVRGDKKAMTPTKEELEKLVLPSVDSAKANGSNSLDEVYFERLRRGEHLTSDFLRGVRRS